MRMWFCGVAGQRYGPISEDELKSWIAQGRVRKEDLVWSEGMPQWVQSGSVPELFGANLPPACNSLSGVNPPGGTGGLTRNKELMTQARAILSGRWGLAVGFAVLAWLLGNAAGVVPCGAIIVMGAFEVSSATFFLAMTRSGKPEISMLFAGFQRFGVALGACLLKFLLTLAWALLFLIPGIVASLRYSMTYYIIADDPNIGPLDAIRESKRMMYGHKWRLFCLQLRFLGWALLCLLTCGIGFLWLAPYVNSSNARFYDDLRQAQANLAASPAPVEPASPIQPAQPDQFVPPATSAGPQF